MSVQTNHTGIMCPKCFPFFIFPFENMHTNRTVRLRSSTVTFSRNTTSVMKLVVSTEKSSQKGSTAAVTQLTLILRRSRTGTVWFYTSTSNKRAARPKLYTESLTRDLKLMYSRLTLMRISINLWAPCVLYIGTGVSLLFRERFLYI